MTNAQRPPLLPRLVLVSATLFAGVAAAQDQSAPKILQLVQTSEQTVAAAVEPQAASVSMTLNNPTATEVAVVANPAFRHDGSTAEVTAIWVRLPDIRPSADNKFVLKPGETVVFKVSGTFAESGAYTATLTTQSQTPALAFPVTIVIARPLAKLPVDFLLEPKPVQIDLGFLEGIDRLVMNRERVVTLVGRNTTITPLEFGQPTAGPLTRGTATAATTAATFAPVKIGGNDCKGVLSPEQGCAMALQIPNGLGPGQYSVDVAISGRGGGQSLRAVKIDIRRSWIVAGFWIAAGVVLGALVTDWRGSGRTMTNRRIDVRDLHDQAADFATNTRQPVIQRKLAEMMRGLLALDARVLEGDDPAATIAEIKGWLKTLRDANLVLSAAGQSARVARIFEKLTANLGAALDSGPWNAAKIDPTLKQLQTELDQFPSLLEAKRLLEQEIGRLSPSVEILRSDSPEIGAALDHARRIQEATSTPLGPRNDDKSEAMERIQAVSSAANELKTLDSTLPPALLDLLKTQVANALATAPPPSPAKKAKLDAIAAELDHLPNRLQKLEAFAGLWIRYQNVAAGTKALPQTESTASGARDAVALEFKIPDARFQAPIGASAAELRKTRKRWDRITDTATLAFIVAGGITTLWLTDTAWGTIDDVVGVFLAGVGTRMAVGAVFQRG